MCIWLPFFLFWVLLLSKAEIMGGGVFYYYIKGYQRRCLFVLLPLLSLAFGLSCSLAAGRPDIMENFEQPHLVLPLSFPIPEV